MVYIILVGDSSHLGLVSHEPYRPPHVGGDHTLEASLPEEAVNGLGLVPALGQRHFWQKGGSFPVPALAVPLYPDAVHAEVPVGPVRAVLELAEDGDGDLEVGELLPRHGAEPRVLHGAGDGVLPEPVLEIHLVECSDAAYNYKTVKFLPIHLKYFLRL